MSSATILRVASRGLCRSLARPAAARWTSARTTQQAAVTKALKPAACAFSTSSRLRSGDHEETFEEFTARYENEFNSVQDVFELQRNLNNAFAYDLVPSPSVVTAALRAARRVNDFPTAVRIFEGIKSKVENPTQYEEYLQELEPVREELGISLKEWMYPDAKA